LEKKKKSNNRPTLVNTKESEHFFVGALHNMFGMKINKDLFKSSRKWLWLNSFCSIYLRLAKAIAQGNTCS
jgi:hypothetical protein